MYMLQKYLFQKLPFSSTIQVQNKSNNEMSSRNSCITGHFDCLKYWQKFFQYRDFLKSFKLIILARPSCNSSHSTPSFGEFHYARSVRIRGYSGAYSVRMQENTDQNNSEYGHFSHSVCKDG